jgi:hypothetical protein
LRLKRSISANFDDGASVEKGVELKVENKKEKTVSKETLNRTE